MPNWCENILEVEDPQGLTPLRNAKGELDFEALLPVPSDEKVLRHAYDVTRGAMGLGDSGRNFTVEEGKYWWQVANWGTKWNVSEVTYDDRAQEVYFDTAWSPPVPIAYELSKKIKGKVTLHYYEPGMWFAGTVIFDNGEVVEEPERDLDEWETVEWVRDKFDYSFGLCHYCERDLAEKQEDYGEHEEICPGLRNPEEKGAPNDTREA